MLPDVTAAPDIELQYNSLHCVFFINKNLSHRPVHCHRYTYLYITQCIFISAVQIYLGLMNNSQDLDENIIKFYLLQLKLSLVKDTY